MNQIPPLPTNQLPLNQLPTSQLTPEDVRRLVIAFTLSAAATYDKDPPGWLIERAFHMGDRVKSLLESEERGERPQHWYAGSKN